MVSVRASCKADTCKTDVRSSVSSPSLSGRTTAAVLKPLRSAENVEKELEITELKLQLAKTTMENLKSRVDSGPANEGNMAGRWWLNREIKDQSSYREGLQAMKKELEAEKLQILHQI